MESDDAFDADDDDGDDGIGDEPDREDCPPESRSATEARASGLDGLADSSKRSEKAAAADSVPGIMPTRASAIRRFLRTTTRTIKTTAKRKKRRATDETSKVLCFEKTGAGDCAAPAVESAPSGEVVASDVGGGGGGDDGGGGGDGGGDGGCGGDGGGDGGGGSGASAMATPYSMVLKSDETFCPAMKRTILSPLMMALPARSSHADQRKSDRR